MSQQFGQKLWEPDQTRTKQTHMTLFTNFVNMKTNQNLLSWENLYEWSITNLGSFWKLMSIYTELKWQKQAKTIYTPPPEGKMQGALWFKEAKLNFAENLLTNIEPEKEIIISYHEGCKQETRTGRTLINRVAKLASALKSLGLKKGDRVSGILTNSIETIESMLAVTSIGGVWSSCSPDFGYYAIVERLKTVEPKIIFYTSEYCYKGEKYSCEKTIQKCCESLPKTRYFVNIGKKRSDKTIPMEKSYNYEELINSAQLQKSSESELYPISFTPMSFNEPLYIMFSSGTTGSPKCIVHGVGGTLLQHKKELMLHCNLKKSDKFVFYTNCSWMMWNWMVSGLSVGASLVLYDGCPSFPNPSSYWEVCEKENLNIVGTSPNYIAYSKNQAINMNKIGNFKELKCILSTGSPLLPEHFFWIYNKLKQDVHLASISGGTDILSCFALGNPNRAVYSGEIQGPGLGLKIVAKKEKDDHNQVSKAELVCVKPFVSMPLYFLKDPQGTKLTNSYFNHYPEEDEVWRHGDYIEQTNNGGIIIHGRSDATLNPNGIRIGTSEIYNCLESIKEIKDSVVIAEKAKDGDKIILFVVLDQKLRLSNKLEEVIRTVIKTLLSKRYLPQKIIQVRGIPYTHNGKKVELIVNKIINGEQIKDTSSISNPKVLEEFMAYKA